MTDSPNPDFDEPKSVSGSLAFRLLRAVFSIYILITFLIASYEIFSEYEAEKTRIERSLEAYENIFGQTIAAALWGFDEEQISATLQGIVRLPDIVGAWLIDAEGKTQYVEGVVDQAQSSNIQTEGSASTDLFFHSFNITYEEYEIGRVYLYSSETLVYAKVKDRLFAVGILFLGQAIVLWLLIFWAFNRYLMRTLERFVGELEATDFDSLEEGQLQLQTFGAHELKRLERVFNAMKQRVLKSKSALETLNADLESQVVRRTKQIARQQQVLEAMARQGRIGAWEFDVQNERLFWTAMTKEIHDLPIEYEPELDQAIKFYKEGESRAVILQAMENAIQRGLPWNVELQLVTSKGREIWVAATGQAQMVDGKCVRLFGSFQDIDARMKVQHELKVAKENAEAADRAKSQFLASMSHEIRTPMNGMIGVLHLLRRGELSEEQTHQTDLALSSANTLLRVIDDILDFSKIEAGKLEIEKTDFDVRDLFSDVAELVSITTQEKGLELFVDLADLAHSRVVGDANRLRQVLLNLLSNASKFTHEGWVKISASTHIDEDQKARLRCEIEDTGIGISATRQKAIFGLFTQVDSSTTRKYGGTGLGLAIVSQLCQLMGGNIEVESELGKGSRFKFEVSLELSASQVSNTHPNLKGKAGLILSRVKPFAEVLFKQLNHWGASVDAQAEAEALSSLELSSLDFVFIDELWYQEDTHAELLAQLKARCQSGAPVFVLVGSSEDEGSSAGLDRYITKPLTQLALARLFEGFSKATEIGTAEVAAKIKPNPTQTTELPAELSESRILLVEDNEVNQWVAQAMLQQYGVQADLAVNGKEAIDMLNASAAERRYALILMDCQMPEMDGYEATGLIRSGACGEDYKSVPIVAMTANAMKGDRDKCIDSGMDDYLAKPIDPDLFENTLMKWIAVERMN